MRRRLAWMLVFAALFAALLPVAAKTLCMEHECTDEDCVYCAFLRRVSSMDGFIAHATPLSHEEVGAGVLCAGVGSARYLAASPVKLCVRLND